MPIPDSHDPDTGACHALTPGQAEVLAGMAGGLSNHEIADALGLALTTVEHRISEFSDQTGIVRRAAVRFAVLHRECCLARHGVAITPYSETVEHHRSLHRGDYEVLRLVALGYADKEIARRLGRALATVCTRLRRLYKRIHLHGRSAVVWAILHTTCCIEIGHPA